MKSMLNAVLSLFTASAMTEVHAERVYIGTSNSKGIYVSELNAMTGELLPPRLAIETKNAGFVAIHPSGKYLYSTAPAAFCIQPDGSLLELNRSGSDGKGPCHVSLDQTGKCLMVAYYGSGSVASFRIGDDGSISESVSFHQHEGSGEHPDRQKGPHAHSIFPNPANTYAYAPDLGIDKVMIYKLQPEAGKLTQAGFAEVPGGSMGPRHMKWNADGTVAYVLNELDLSVSIFKAGKNGNLEFLKSVSVLPDKADKSEMTCAEIRIHPNGKFIYTSNRDLTQQGRDSITVFSRFEDGFQRLETEYAEVRVPRNFNLDPSGKWMLVGGQKSRDIAIFSVDTETGLIQFTGNKVQFEGGPICFEFLD